MGAGNKPDFTPSPQGHIGYTAHHLPQARLGDKGLGLVHFLASR
jgi:hypothetical protein